LLEFLNSMEKLLLSRPSIDIYRFVICVVIFKLTRWLYGGRPSMRFVSMHSLPLCCSSAAS
jgi:hypothetical protein